MFSNLSKTLLRASKLLKCTVSNISNHCPKDQLKQLNFYYPEYVSPFSVSINPNYSQWMDRYCSQWAIDSCGAMGRNEKYRNAIRKSDCGLFAAVVYPTADWHRIEKLMKWSLIFFICDDYHDMCVEQKSQQFKVKPFWDQIIDALESLRDHDSCLETNDWPEFVRAVHQVLKEIYFDYSPTQLQRSIIMIKDYIEGNVGESKWASDKDQLPDWDNYWNARLGSVGGQMALQFIEYEKNIELTDNEWNNPSIQELGRLVSEEMILVNDYYTFRKEVDENDGNWMQMKHSFPILMKQGLSLQDAINRVNKMIKETDLKIISSMNKLRNTNDSPAVIQYIDGVDHFVGGYWRHAVTARRYHGLDFQGVIPFKGRFVYDCNRTVIEDNDRPTIHWFKPIPTNVKPIN